VWSINGAYVKKNNNYNNTKEDSKNNLSPLPTPTKEPPLLLPTLLSRFL
jgi:hypothetical protein